jgi:hypothetical protein
MHLILPLKYYDEAGRVKPPAVFWLLLLLICRAYFVFIAALSYRQDSAYLLALFYPRHSYFYWSVALALPALVVFGLCGFRDKLWQHGIFRFVYLVRPLLYCAIIADFVLHLFMARQQYWQFSWLIALTLLLDFSLLLYLFSSKHLALMLRDWRSPL